MEELDCELLINLVQEREVLWDKTTEIYKDKRQNAKAWQEICLILNEKFETLSEKEKNEYGKLLLHKWRNLKDSWIKYEKKLCENKSGSGAKVLHKYVYYDNMQFLKKIVTTRVTGSNMPQQFSNNNNVDSRIGPKRSRSSTTTTPIHDKVLKFIDSVENEDESRSMSFFKSISATVDTFSDTDMVEFQYQVMCVIRNIKNRNTNTQHYTYNTPNNVMSSHRINTQHSSYEYNAGASPCYGYRTAAAATTELPFTRHPETENSNYSGNSSISDIARSPDESTIDDLDFSILN